MNRIRTLLMVLLFAFAFSVVGCKEDVDLSYYDQYEGYVLEGYPEDILPMYKMIAVDRCNLQVGKVYDYPINTYNITYYTRASESELRNFYKGILGGQASGDSELLMGEKDGYDLMVSIQPEDDDICVTLSVDLPREISEENNRFFKNFKMDLVDKYVTGNEKIEYEDYGCTSNYDGTLEYRYIYEAITSAQEVEKKLTEYYSENNDFKVYKDIDGDIHISWTAGEYKVTVAYEEEYNRVTVYIVEPMKKASS